MHWESLLAKEGKRKHYDKSCHRKQRGKYLKAGKKKSRIKQASFQRREQFPLMELRKEVREKQESFQRKEQFPFESGKEKKVT